MWLLANWKLLAIVGAAMAMFGAGWYVESQIAESRLQRELAAQELVLQAKCDTDKKLTEESSRAYQTKVSDLSRRLSAAKRVFPTKCIVPFAGQASGGNGGTATAGHAGVDSVPIEPILDYGATCERLRIQVISLQDFINETWKTH